ncbi:MAG: N-6 DNA methylase, partial [Acidobacteria bacterium]|nr:N-6 DNA methylase [Acidobacteriota bacterium]
MQRIVTPQDQARNYELSLPIQHRRATGTVYTPGFIVELMLDLIGYTSEGDLAGLSLLDPACGCGVFLIHAVRRLAAAMAARGAPLSTSHGGRAFARAVESCIHGSDIDASACELARNAVRHEVQQLTTGQALDESFFSGNVLVADFLKVPPQQD